jgi:hypothetical protein
VRSFGRQVVLRICTLNTTRGLGLDLPNTHNLIEYLLRELPSILCAHFTRTSVFEAVHKNSKTCAQNALFGMKKCISVVNRHVLIIFLFHIDQEVERHTLKAVQSIDDIRYALHGGKWGPGLQLKVNIYLFLLFSLRLSIAYLPSSFLIYYLIPFHFDRLVHCY